MRLAIVVQRYGEDIVGGAESHARLIAEKMKQDLGWHVRVYTTTALSYQTWRNELKPGVSVINGVEVLRFRSFLGRSFFFPIYDRVARKLIGKRSSFWLWKIIVTLLEWLWIVLQGPVSLALVRALRRDIASLDKIVFFTYLYYPTVAGIFALKSARQKVVLVPTAHDEPAFQFGVIKRMLMIPDCILANTPAEVALLKSVIDHQNIKIAGIGFDDQFFVPKSPQDSPPYLLYLGRISAGKGVHQLIDWFTAFKRLRPASTLELHLAGKLEGIDLADTSSVGIVYHGFVTEDEKLLLLQGALALVNPSPFESLSMIVIEALATKIPVLVNGHCAVLRQYSEELATVLAFRDQKSFMTSIDALLSTDWTREEYQQKLEESRRWASRHFSWPNVLSVYQAACLP